MKIIQADSNVRKGWFAGPWNSDLPLSVGYANAGVDEPHQHTRMTEIYLIARGTALLRVEQTTLHLTAGDMVVIEPGEAHTFLENSPDYFHFVLHTPALQGDAARDDKVSVERSRLGL